MVIRLIAVEASGPGLSRAVAGRNNRDADYSLTDAGERKERSRHALYPATRQNGQDCLRELLDEPLA